MDSLSLSLEKLAERGIWQDGGGYAQACACVINLADSSDQNTRDLTLNMDDELVTAFGLVEDSDWHDLKLDVSKRFGGPIKPDAVLRMKDQDGNQGFIVSRMKQA